MRLRTFIIAASLSVVALLGSLFIFQMGRLLTKGFNQMNATYEKDLHQVILSSLESKKSSLRTFGEILGVNFNLSGIYVVAKETNDVKLVQPALNSIRRRSGFDIVDIFNPQGGTAISEGFRIEPEQFAQVVARPDRLAVIEIAGELNLVGLYPLFLYDETVGYIVLGYNLNRAVAAELSRGAEARVSFRIFPGTQINDPTLLPTHLSSASGAPVEMRIDIDARIISHITAALARSLVLFGSLCLICLGGLIYFAIEFGILRKFQVYLNEIDRASAQLAHGKLPQLKLKPNKIVEIDRLAHSFNHFSQSLEDYDGRIKEQSRLTAEAQKESALAEMAQEVAHNIRSPLSALDMLIAASQGLSDDTRLLVRGAIQRIQDIGNQLLVANRKPEGRNQFPLHLVSALESLVAEKRVQFSAGHQKTVALEVNWSNEATEAFSRIDSAELKSVLSNLINNAVEAARGDARVEIAADLNGNEITIAVSDNGVGIPAAVLTQLGYKGATFGKKEGSGLGLYHAKKTIENAGGRVQILSTEGQGTQILVVLPIVDKPAWFTRTLPAVEGLTVVLDDDPAMLRAWENILANERFIAFNCAADWSQWVEENRDTLGQHLFLCDLNLRETETNGLKLIADFDLTANAILVTSQSEDASVIAECERLGIKLFPKTLVRYLDGSS